MHCTMTLHTAFQISNVDPKVFSSFVEQLGRCVYGGLYDPSHPDATPEGFRTDVMSLVSELAPPAIRYPGGNYASNYCWKDSIGPIEQRPVRLDLAWKSKDPNIFGLKEFMTWCAQTGIEPIMTVNLGTEGVSEARDLVEYCNFPEGSAWSDLRRSHGSEKPFAIKTWCLGNEMDGPWQVGHKEAYEYGRLASETAKAMKWVDPDIKVVACGSSAPGLPTFPEWELTVLDKCYADVDYISLHQYYRNDKDDLETFLGSSLTMDRYIRTVVNACDFIKAKHRSKKTMYLSFDEWNVWFHSHQKDKEQESWTVGPHLLEDEYTFEDALVVGTLLNTLMRHADRVKLACYAQLVNVIAPIMTENGGAAWKQTIFWPIAYASRYGRGTVLDTPVAVPSYENATHGTVPYIDAVAIWHEESGELDIFAVSRHPVETMDFTLECGGIDLSGYRCEHTELAHPDMKAVNTRSNPHEVEPSTSTGEQAGKLTAKDFKTHVRPLTWNLFRLIPR